MRPFVFAVTAIALAGCLPEPHAVWRADKAKAEKLFFRCLEAAPSAGSIAVTTSREKAMGDMVRACRDTSLSLTKRCVRHCKQGDAQ